MKKTLFSVIAAAFACLMILVGCNTPRTAVGTTAIAPFDSYIMSNNPDGSVLIKAWGTGGNRSQAVDAAIQKAVYDVVFSGFKSGPGLRGGAIVKPLIDEVNAPERYDYFFSTFFAPGGEYLKFAQEDKTNKTAREEGKTSGRVSMGAPVYVDRGALKRRLIDAGIIKP